MKQVTVIVYRKEKKKRFKKKKKDKVHKNTIVYILTIKRKLPVFKVFLISLRPGVVCVVCYPHLYISHFPLYTLFTHTPPPRPFLYVKCKGRFVFACPVTLTVRSLKTRKGEKSGGLLILSPFSHSFSKTGYWSLRRRIVSFHVLNTNLSRDIVFICIALRLWWVFS